MTETRQNTASKMFKSVNLKRYSQLLNFNIVYYEQTKCMLSRV